MKNWLQIKTRALVDEIVRQMPQMIERKVFVTKKNITSQFRNELQALKERLYGIDNFVQEQFTQTSQT